MRVYYLNLLKIKRMLMLGFLFGTVILIMAVTLTRHVPPSNPVQARPHALYKVQTSQKVAALTFNISQNNKNIDSLLDNLKNVHSTFFTSSTWVKNNPDLARRIIREGHEIGILSTSSQESVEKIKEEILKASQLINKTTGRPPVLIRASRDNYDDLLLITASGAGYPVVQWSIDVLNQMNVDKDTIVDNIYKNIHHGAIILLPCNTQAAGALPSLVEKLAASGYKMITVPEMMKLGPAGAE